MKENGIVSWKIWILCTGIKDLDLHPEDESLLQASGRSLDGLKTMETDVFMIGGGNAAVVLAARLKAFGVDSIIAERNPRVGDNWGRRYDCMKFHIPTSYCEMPYMSKSRIAPTQRKRGFLQLLDTVSLSTELISGSRIRSGVSEPEPPHQRQPGRSTAKVFSCLPPQHDQLGQDLINQLRRSN